MRLPGGYNSFSLFSYGDGEDETPAMAPTDESPTSIAGIPTTAEMPAGMPDEMPVAPTTAEMPVDTPVAPTMAERPVTAPTQGEFVL